LPSIASPFQNTLLRLRSFPIEAMTTLKIFQVLPRRMDFGIAASTSVELCVADWVMGSRYCDTTTIVAEKAEGPPLFETQFLRLTPARYLSSWRAAWEIRKAAAASGGDIIVAQQHIATAARYAAFNPSLPIVLQTHNFVEGRREGRAGMAWNRQMQRRLSRLGGITFISRATLRDFEENWPEIRVPRAIVHNGFDFSQWSPAAERQKLIIAAGRTQPEKGLLEAAEGTAAFLSAHSDWSAIFLLSEPDRNPAYRDAIIAKLAPVKAQAQILWSIPFKEVKEMTETAAIAIVASTWREPFGRTALEAHAGGAALLSSGTGGLREISGDCAAYIDEVSGPAITAMLEKLAANEGWRRELAEAAGKRVRRLFPLSDFVDETGTRVPSVAGTLDSFYDEVTQAWRMRSKNRR